MNNYQSLAEAIQAWATKYRLGDKYAFQVIYAAFLSTVENFELLREQKAVTVSMFKDFNDNFLEGYDMSMLEFELKKNAEEIYRESGEDWLKVDILRKKTIFVPDTITL